MKLLQCSENFRLRGSPRFKISLVVVSCFLRMWCFLYSESYQCSHLPSTQTWNEITLPSNWSKKYVRHNLGGEKKVLVVLLLNFPAVCVFIRGPWAGLKGSPRETRRCVAVVTKQYSPTLSFLSPPARTHWHTHTPPPLVRRWFSWRPHGRGEGSGLAPSVYVMGIGAKRHGGWRERKGGSCGVGG